MWPINNGYKNNDFIIIGLFHEKYTENDHSFMI